MMHTVRVRAAWTATLTVLVCGFGHPTPARAQENRDLSEVIRDVVQDVTRELGPALREVSRELGPALRDVVRELGPALRGVTLEAAEQNRNYRSERTDRSTRTLALGAAGSLELRNVSGNITVTTGSGRDVTVEIVKLSRGRTDADAARGLQEVEVTFDHRGERALVETVYPRGNVPYSVTTTYTVTAPAGTRVTARSVSGDVSVKDVKGDVAAETVSGNVTVTSAGRVSRARSVSGNVQLTDVNNDGALTSGTVSGNVGLVRVKASRIAVDVVSGDVRAEDVTADSAQIRSLSGSVDYVGRLARSGRYELNSHSGSVRIVALGPVGFELQATTFSGSIRSEGLSLESVSRNRGSLRARVGDGSAVVVAGSFSGDVVVGRK